MAALVEEVVALERTLDDLVWAIEQGQTPGSGGHALADRYENGASDLRNLVRQAREAAVAGCTPLTSGGGNGPYEEALASARQELLRCQDALHAAQEIFYNEMMCFESLQMLDTLGRERRRSWGPWVQGVRDALEHSAPAIAGAVRSLSPCWRELITPAERPAVLAHVVTAAASRSRRPDRESTAN
jgi:hypothetical protein